MVPVRYSVVKDHYFSRISPPAPGFPPRTGRNSQEFPRLRNFKRQRDFSKLLILRFKPVLRFKPIFAKQTQILVVFDWLVGLDRLELSTSPLSGVRSSHLSYRPVWWYPNWWSWSGSNRRPPECKSGALPAELQPLDKYRKVINRGRLDAGFSTRPNPKLNIKTRVEI